MSKKTGFFIVLFFLCFVLPGYLAAKETPPAFKLLLLFYLVNSFTFLFFLKRNSDKKYYLQYQLQNLQEKLNLVNDERLKEHQSASGLNEKIARYDSLKGIIEEINQNLDLEAVAESLARIAFSVISNGRGLCLLYLVDAANQKLSLFKTKKENKNLIIRAKEGDVFDLWVSRHAGALLVEDIKKDFRFDLERLKEDSERPVASLISAPLISEDKFLGILRLDNEMAHYYSQDDLRFLVTLCDLGAVAIENSQLFKYTQDLAIHDALTGLFTKGFFLQQLKEECRRSLRKNTEFSLLMLDIDFFKNYNDQFGHTAGDIVLRKLSQIITESLNELNPVISRFGGEEFCIMLLGADKQKALKTAETLRERIGSEKIILRRQETKVTVSIGVASFPAHAASEEELIQKADKAMYTAKQKGRNRVCCI